MGRIVIVAYRPKPGRGSELRSLCAQHIPTLLAEGLVTSRPPIIAEAADGSIVEVFEWASPDAIARAHGSSAVQRLWARYAEVCDYVPIATVPEASRLFSEFTPIP
jgi:quinol monooxygenase YgiN